MWDLLNGFDFSISRWLNGYAGASDYLDYFAWRIANNDLVKGGVMMGLLWAAWSLDRPERDVPTDMVRAFTGMALAILVGRALQLFLPLRLRPMHEPRLGFQAPRNVPEATLDGWSSFPSDHAILYTAVAVALFWRSRVLLALGLVWAAVLILLPRIYVGVHYSSDIIVGCAVGAIIMILAMEMPVPEKLLLTVRKVHRLNPALFQMLAFMAAFEVASQFRGSRFFVASFGYLVGIEM